MNSRTAIVVTGGSSGLGAAAAQRFAASGHTVHVFDLHPGDSAADTGETDGRVVFHQTDVRSDDSVRAAFTAVEQAGEELRGIVHCAGIAAFGPHNPGQLLHGEDHSPLDNLGTVENVLDTNLLGTFRIVRHGASLMARNGRHPAEENGFIVLTSSGAAFDGKAGQSAYVASKAAIIGMTLPLAREFSAIGVRVVTIAPGLFNTPILDDTPKIERHVPYPARVGDPDEFARLALHIAENHYINADVIRIDGGTRGEFRSASPFIR
ncbi:SDR family NAD(P)-dependent oxidoreductase [Dietzia natronolimnaea]|uniref:SDR family NAD(P)-dependent oxidoreductase n=1 Tax=Dietzia natronolimnaea TaxID=161920 RepID=UPI0015FC5732|nr:SDR family NAD(P)-dependent oxidoreductase [Dietzia natronolimnaea]MBB1037672.1 SDR family NAD(P)-dependent oxidoreductase [Dietzia natronolimnaea]